MDALRTVEDEVRELIRRRGLDPAREDRRCCASWSATAVADYDERSLPRWPRCRCPTWPTATRSVFDAVAGFGPLQRYLDDPTVEEIWINEPGRVFVARRGRRELTTTILDRDAGARPGRADAQDLRPAGRPVSSPFVDAMLPDGSPAARGHPGHHPAALAVNIRKFVRRGGPPRRAGRSSARSPPQAARFLEARSSPGSTSSSPAAPRPARRRCSTACAAAIPARERVITCEEVFELRVPLPDVVAMQTRQPNLEGTGEIPLRRLVKEALRMRPSPDHRRRGAAGGVPRPADRAEHRPARHVHAARQLRPRGGGQDVHAAAAGRGERRQPRSSCRRSPASVDLVVHIGTRRATAHRRVREIVAVPGRVEGGVVETADAVHHARRASWSAPTATRRTPSGSPRAASTSPRCSRDGAP